MTSKLQIVQRAQLQMSHREQSRPLVQLWPDESPRPRRQNQTQSEHFYLVLSDGNKKYSSLWVENASQHDKNRCFLFSSKGGK